MGLFDLIFDPRRDPTPPAKPKRTKRTNRTPGKKPDNLEWDNNGRPWLFDQDTETGQQEWERYRLTSHERDSKVRQADLDQIEEHGLNQDKYRVIKARWCQTRKDGEYKSAQDTSTELTTDLGYGYGIRTVQKYYGAINRANPSPT